MNSFDKKLVKIALQLDKRAKSGDVLMSHAEFGWPQYESGLAPWETVRRRFVIPNPDYETGPQWLSDDAIRTLAQECKSASDFLQCADEREEEMKNGPVPQWAIVQMRQRLSAAEFEKWRAAYLDPREPEASE
jgi:hypothetical protein